MTPLGARILDRLRRDPGRVVSVFLRDGAADHPVTAERLLARARGFAVALADGPSVPPGSVAAICLYPGLDLHAAWLGALLAGFVPTMVAPPSPRMEPAKYAAGFRAMAGHIAARAWVVDREAAAPLGADLSGLAGRFVVATEVADVEAGLDTGPGAGPGPAGDLDAVTVLQHSSGTTGLQKAIGLTSRQIFAHDEAYAGALGLSAADTVVSWLPLYHDMGFVACFLMPLLRGMRVVELSPFDWVRRPLGLLDAIDRYQGTHCWLPNFAFAFLASARDRAGSRGAWNLSSIRAWVNSSEPVLASSFDRFLAAYADSGVTRGQLTASYAMAENVYAVTQSLPGRLREIRVDRDALARHRVRPVAADGVVLVSNGPVLPATEVRVLGSAGEVLGPGEVGEIALRGACRFAGYVGRPDLTAAAIDADGWYHTGDLGALVDGELYVTGRAKDLIIIQGRNFYPGDIEAAAADVPGVAAGRVAAFGVPDDATGTERLVVLFELAPGVAADAGAATALRVRAHVAQTFNCTADDVRAVPPRWLVKSTSGKVARADNRAKYLADVH
ncbi:MAG: AMP-binding protein [Vicinamibacterales bacterium]